jgi:hypothetical protein
LQIRPLLSDGGRAWGFVFYLLGVFGEGVPRGDKKKYLVAAAVNDGVGVSVGLSTVGVLILSTA